MTDDELRELAGAGPARNKGPEEAWNLVDLDGEETGR